MHQGLPSCVELGQKCQGLPNLGSELQLDFRRRSRGLRKLLWLDSRLARSHRRREKTVLHDMQKYKIKECTLFHLFHRKIAL
jgi:hypothetical protein